MPLIRVAAVVLRDVEGRVLTVRKRGTQRFMLPGGKPEEGELFRHTAKREVSEELGLDLHEAHLEPMAFFLSQAANEPGHELESHVFRYTAALNKTPVVAAEIEELRWLTEDELRVPSSNLALAPMLQFDAAPVLFGWADAADKATTASLQAAYMTMHENARGKAAHRGERSISVAQYDDARRKYLHRQDDQSRPGVFTWPPTSQTLMASLGNGSWAGAMKTMGLLTAAGRARGASSIGEAAYQETMRDFLKVVADEQRPDISSSSFAQFERWLRDEKSAGRTRPSAAGVRRHFGSWEAAKESGQAGSSAS